MTVPRRSALKETLGRLISGEHDAEHRDVDLLIRSGGEERLSDFLLWECAYAELSSATGCGPCCPIMALTV
jgi:undecaprenyl diphosphate synthase